MSLTSVTREAKHTVTFTLDAFRCDGCGLQTITGHPRDASGRPFRPDELPAQLLGEFGSARDWAYFAAGVSALPDELLHFCPACTPAVVAALKGLRK